MWTVFLTKKEVLKLLVKTKNKAKKGIGIVFKELEKKENWVQNFEECFRY